MSSMRLNFANRSESNAITTSRQHFENLQLEQTMKHDTALTEAQQFKTFEQAIASSNHIVCNHRIVVANEYTKEKNHCQPPCCNRSTKDDLYRENTLENFMTRTKYECLQLIPCQTFPDLIPMPGSGYTKFHCSRLHVFVLWFGQQSEKNLEPFLKKGAQSDKIFVWICSSMNNRHTVNFLSYNIVKH